MAAPRIKRSLQLTVGGTLYAGVVIIVCLAAMSSQANLLYLLGGMGASVFVVSFLLSHAAVRDIDVERTLPDETVRGRSFPVTYTIRNRRWWARVASVRIDVPESTDGLQINDVYLPAIAAGETVTVRTRGICLRRGRLACGPIRISTRYPLSLLGRSALIETGRHIVAFPPIGRLRRDPWTSDEHVGQGYSTHTGGRRGTSSEFYGIREYRHGDNVRFIHWRRSARTGQLLVREMAQYRAARLIVVLDTQSRDDSPMDLAAVEEVVGYTATLVCDALDKGYQVGMIANAHASVVVPPGQGRPHHRRLLTELAMLAPQRGRPLAEVVGRVPWTNAWQAKCVIVGTHDDASHERVARLLLRKSNAVAVLHAGTDALRSAYDPADGRGETAKT